MLKFYETNNIIIDTKNNKYEYTYQVLRNIKKEYKNSEIYLIIGNDILENFSKWKNINEILKYNIIVIKRKCTIQVQPICSWHNDCWGTC